ncbi:DNA-binding transcriptional LysR family regulator [Streptomyces sp. B1I3]|nr:DNA-binding transcriptional LysR family regulator [Streptomyces sp. B1I3]
MRVLPALTPLLSQGLALRTTFLAKTEEALEGLAAGHHDLAITTARPRGGLLTATTLCDEEHVLVAAPRWAGRLGPGALRHKGSVVLEQLPVVEVHESLPLVSRYWAAVFESRPAASATVIAPDLRAVLECAVAGAGPAVLPRYLCEDALERGEIIALLDPPVPPLRTYFPVLRTGTLALPHIARAHEWLVRAAVDW